MRLLLNKTPLKGKYQTLAAACSAASALSIRTFSKIEIEIESEIESRIVQSYFNGKPTLDLTAKVLEVITEQAKYRAPPPVQSASRPFQTCRKPGMATI